MSDRRCPLPRSHPGTWRARCASRIFRTLMSLLLVVLGPGWVDVEQAENAALGGGEPVQTEPVRGVGGAESLERGEDVAAGGSGCAAFGEQARQLLIGAEGVAQVGFDKAVDE